jgi:DNA-directed RNA polymerase I subunit RPA1
LQSIPKCHYCGIYSPKLRIDSHNKIFQVPLSKKYQQYNQQVSKSSSLSTDGTYTFPSASATYSSTNDDETNGAPNAATSTTYDSDDTEMMEDDDDDDDDDDLEEKDGNDDGGGGNETANEGVTNTPTTNRDNDTDVAPSSGKNTKGKPRDMYLPPTEIFALVRRIYERDNELCRNLFSIAHYEQYFLQCIAVLPNRFRPPMKVGGNASMVEHVQTAFYQQILQANATLRDQIAAITTNTGSNHTTNSAYQTWIELQTAVNCYMDSSKDPKKTASMNVSSGIRQILERKEGLFRKHMMGKRVNYACRSVISPDPYIGSNEIGLPKYFCTILTYPTYVTPMNVVSLRNAVLRGPHHYPGARWVQFTSSASSVPTKIDLSKMKFHQRQSIAAQLLGSHNSSRGPPTIVGRQLQDGDYVLMNRQVSVG